MKNGNEISTSEVETNADCGVRFVTLGVLAGAYVERKSMLTHLADMSAETAMCRGVKFDNLADFYAHTEAERRGRPTCKACSKKWDLLCK